MKRSMMILLLIFTSIVYAESTSVLGYENESLGTEEQILEEDYVVLEEDYVEPATIEIVNSPEIIEEEPSVSPPMVGSESEPIILETPNEQPTMISEETSTSSEIPEAIPSARPIVEESPSTTQPSLPTPPTGSEGTSIPSEIPTPPSPRPVEENPLTTQPSLPTPPTGSGGTSTPSEIPTPPSPRPVEENPSTTQPSLPTPPTGSEGTSTPSEIPSPPSPRPVEESPSTTQPSLPTPPIGSEGTSTPSEIPNPPSPRPVEENPSTQPWLPTPPTGSEGTSTPSEIPSPPSPRPVDENSSSTEQPQPSLPETPEVIEEQKPINDSSSSCKNPATYSNKTREAFLPTVEIPLYTDIDGQPLFIDDQPVLIGLYSATLRISFGFSSFEVIELKGLNISTESDPCNARFNPETGLLDIPQINVPTLVFMANQVPVSGPVIECSATLQQSVIRIDILELTKFDCAL